MMLTEREERIIMCAVKPFIHLPVFECNILEMLTFQIFVDWDPEDSNN